MAQPLNTFSSNDMVGIREDLSDMIYDISPTATPLLSALDKVKATDTTHSWQTDALRSSAANAHIEGSDITANAVTATVKLNNEIQIMVESVRVTDLDKRLKKAGRGADLARAIKRNVKVMKLDAERNLYLNQAKVAGTDSVAGLSAGLQAWMATNTSHGTSGSASAGTGADTRTEGTDRPLTQTIFETEMQSCWNAGGEPSTVFLHGDQMNVVLGFTGFGNQRATIDAVKGKIINAVELFQTQWGTVSFKMSRECPSTELFILETGRWAVAELQGMRNFALAKTGMSEARAMDWAWTLEARNEKASGMIADLS